ncbi:MAG: RNA 2',3'-cyclic phosphodiesterase [Propionivibrio sp.]
MRLFFALWPSLAAAEQLAAAAVEAAARLGGRPMRRETLHLTLAFLGEVADERVLHLLELAEDLPVPPFNLRIDQPGYWRRNRLLWAGCRDVPAPLETLTAELCLRLAAAGFVANNGERKFTPHVTLVRKVPEIAQDAVLPSIEAVEWRCSDFVLVRSRLSEIGPSYEPLSRFALADDRNG